jgi:hypothetical protein
MRKRNLIKGKAPSHRSSLLIKLKIKRNRLFNMRGNKREDFKFWIRVVLMIVRKRNFREK